MEDRVEEAVRKKKRRVRRRLRLRSVLRRSNAELKMLRLIANVRMNRCGQSRNLPCILKKTRRHGKNTLPI